MDINLFRKSLASKTKTSLLREAAPKMSTAKNDENDWFREWYKEMVKNTNKYLDKADKQLDNAYEILSDAETELEDYKDISGLSASEKRSCAELLAALRNSMKQLKQISGKKL